MRMPGYVFTSRCACLIRFADRIRSGSLCRQAHENLWAASAQSGFERNLSRSGIRLGYARGSPFPRHRFTSFTHPVRHPSNTFVRPFTSRLRRGQHNNGVCPFPRKLSVSLPVYDPYPFSLRSPLIERDFSTINGGKRSRDEIASLRSRLHAII
jgi:hypothetical protein